MKSSKFIHKLSDSDMKQGILHVQGDDYVQLYKVVSRHLGKKANIGTPDGIIERTINDNNLVRKNRATIKRIRIHLPWIKTLDKGVVISIEQGDVSFVDYEVKLTGSHD